MTAAEANKSSPPAFHVNLKGEGITDALKEQIIAGLKKVYDPEIPVDVYELGLIYDVEVTPAMDWISRKARART